LSSIPLMFLVDAKNKIVKRYDGASESNLADLTSRLKMMIKQ
jgi:hypothetical protein